LAGTFLPGLSASHLAVKVHHLPLQDLGTPYSSELVVPPEEAHLGLPGELVDAVMSGVNEQLIIGPDPGPGELVFDRAVYGIVGSSEETFRMLARVVVRLLATSLDDDEELTSALLEILW
jgi:hypothetical protein